MLPRLLSLVLLCSIFADSAQSAAPPTPRKKIVLIAGKKSHGPEGNGLHDYGWSAKLLRVMLERSNVRDLVRVEHHLDGWPRDPRTLEDADAIMVLSDGRDGNLYEEAPFLASPERVRFMDRQMKRGCGFLTFHFSTFAPQKYAAEVLRWNGGYFQWEQGGKRDWYSAIRTLSAEVAVASPEHPIARGLKAFRLEDEFYYNLRFAKDDPALVPIWSVASLGGRKPDGNVVAWARQREDGGRGFGTTAGHFYRNWENPSFRKTILNAIAWAAKLDVPAGGVESKYYTHAEIDAALAGPPIRVLLVAGNEAHSWHNWKKTSPVLRAALDRDPRVRVDVALDFEELGRRKLSDYHTILLNSYCNWHDPKPPGEKSREAFAKYLREGGGLVLVHFANGAFHRSLPKAGASDWPEYRKIVRRVWDHAPPRGKPVSSHDAFGRFVVMPTKVGHPITDGLGRFEVFDELYFNQEGDEPIEALVSAESKVSRKLEPLAWAYSYGKGRVFQTLLGHSEKTYDAFEAREMLRRAVAWTANRPMTVVQDPSSLRLYVGPREKMHVYALLGQSNMSGRAPVEKADETPSPGVFLFDDFDQFEAASHPLNRFTNVPSGTDRVANRLNLGWNFAAKMRSSDPAVSVGLVVNAQGGSAIRTWKKGQPNYDRTLTRLRAAQAAGHLKGVLWHQGEEDIHAADGYLDALAKLVADLRADLGDPKLPFVAGQLSPLTSGKDAEATRRFNEMLSGLPKKVAHTAVVESKGLTGGLHFDARSTRLLGERYAEAMLAARIGK